MLKVDILEKKQENLPEFAMDSLLHAWQKALCGIAP